MKKALTVTTCASDNHLTLLLATAPAFPPPMRCWKTKAFAAGNCQERVTRSATSEKAGMSFRRDSNLMVTFVPIVMVPVNERSRREVERSIEMENLRISFGCWCHQGILRIIIFFCVSAVVLSSFVASCQHKMMMM